MTEHRAYRQRQKKDREWERKKGSDLYKETKKGKKKSNGLENREGEEKRAREQDRGGEKGKKGEPGGQGDIARNNWAGSRIEK